VATAAEDLYRAVGDDSGTCLAGIAHATTHILGGQVALAAGELEALLATPFIAANEALATRVRSALGLALFYAGSFDLDEENLHRNLAQAQALHQEYLEALLLSGLSTSFAFQGRTAEARTAVHKSKAISPVWRDAPVLEFEVQALWLEGDLPAAVERAEEILQWNPDGMSRRRALGLAFCGMAAMETGGLETARRYIDLALAAYEGRVYCHCLDECLHAQGVLMARDGHAKDGLEIIEAAAGRLYENGFRPYAMLALTDLADVAATAGDAERAAWAAATAAATAAVIDRDCYRGLALLAGTSAALAAGVADEAAEHARDAVKVLSLTGWRLFKARAFDGLGQALRHRDPAAARQALDDAAALFEACGATWRRDRALDARP
jgi:tetratricopeptide (TPR) repeat protein